MATPTTSVPAPDWLTRRGTVLRLGLGNTWYVIFDDEPQYALKITPAAGKHTCLVTQAQSGKLLGQGTVYPTPDEALRGGLEQLRQALGW